MQDCFIEFVQYSWILGVGQPQKSEMMITALKMGITAIQKNSLEYPWFVAHNDALLESTGLFGTQCRIPHHLPVACSMVDIYIFLNQRTRRKMASCMIKFSPHGLPLGTNLLHMKGDSNANTPTMNKAKARLAMTVLRFMHGHVYMFVFELQHHKAKQ